MEVKIKRFLINSQLLGQTTVVSSWVWLKNSLCDERSTLWLYKMVFSIAAYYVCNTLLPLSKPPLKRREALRLTRGWGLVCIETEKRYSSWLFNNSEYY
ncbi:MULTISPECIES: hypothetical protein [unclassified Nostoc]|nr:hypothetical protein [Nostoc sp. JL23]MBN3876090.1 hypothetical protein [Nostoc sp. JL23]